MSSLLDECVTRYLKPDFVGHDVFTVEEAGLKGLKNGELLRAMTGSSTLSSQSIAIYLFNKI